MSPSNVVIAPTCDYTARDEPKKINDSSKLLNEAKSFYDNVLKRALDNRDEREVIEGKSSEFP